MHVDIRKKFPFLNKITKIYISLTLWLECSWMVQKTEVQSQIKSYQRLTKKKKKKKKKKKRERETGYLLNTQHYKLWIKGKE